MIVVPATHPAALLREQTQQVCLVSDLKKAARIQREGVTRVPPPFEDWQWKPLVYDVLGWLRGTGQLVAERDERNTIDEWSPGVVVDIEATFQDDIVCIGLWPLYRLEVGICIPFRTQGGGFYWHEPSASEVKVALCNLLSDPRIPKVGQNFVGFDAPLLKRVWGVETRGIIGDTMIAHHLVWPELPHSLAFQSSMVTDMSPYKLEVHQGDDADDREKSCARIYDYEDAELRQYCLRDCYATKLAWLELEREMA